MLSMMVLKTNKLKCHIGSCIAVVEIFLYSKENSKTSGTLVDEGCCCSCAKGYSRDHAQGV